jgi:hypothetical protein
MSLQARHTYGCENLWSLYLLVTHITAMDLENGTEWLHIDLRCHNALQKDTSCLSRSSRRRVGLKVKISPVLVKYELIFLHFENSLIHRPGTVPQAYCSLCNFCLRPGSMAYLTVVCGYWPPALQAMHRRGSTNNHVRLHGLSTAYPCSTREPKRTFSQQRGK